MPVKINGTTSGSVTLAAPASGSDVTLTLPGSTMDLSSELAAKLPIAGGKVLQIVCATDSSGRTTTSTSFVDVTGMSVTITPQFSTSAIMVIASFVANPFNPSNDRTGQLHQITDAANAAITGAQYSFTYLQQVSSTAQRDLLIHQTLIGWNSPGTTSATTYKLRFAAFNVTNQTARVRNDFSTGQIFAIEVSA